MDAARELFYAHGYATTALDQVAKAAGVRRSTLYLHFSDKDELLRQIAAEYGAQLFALMVKLQVRCQRARKLMPGSSSSQNS